MRFAKARPDRKTITQTGVIMTDTTEAPGAGHNSERFAKDQLKSIIERIERMEDEKDVIAIDIRDVYTEAKGNGYDVKALRTIIRFRKQDQDERARFEGMLDIYMQALGMI
jgi:uncharacterized protein (UPF0335 family)